MSLLALKVDVDTYRGTLEGVPRLLDLFAREGIRATFFFSLGPDNTGKAVRRVLRRGFLRKVLSASPAASYGVRTMLYGTLLPAPDIGADPRAVRRMRETAAAGHAVGIHAWDHVDWHDRLPRMPREEVEEAVARAHDRFREILGKPATISAAPGWTATPLSVEVQEARGIEVSSDTRGGGPFHPLRTDGAPSKVIEVPSTLPTLDELLAMTLPGSGSQVEKACEILRMRMRKKEKERRDEADGRAVAGAPSVADRSFEVHSMHTEIEGGVAFLEAFSRLLAGWKDDGVRFLTFEELRAAVLSLRTWPARRLKFTAVPGRATPVAAGEEEG